MHKKIPKVCTGCRVSAAKIYLYHSTEIAKAIGHIVKEFLKNYENLQNLFFLKTLLIRISLR
jgi:hypothetical protein